MKYTLNGVSFMATNPLMRLDIRASNLYENNQCDARIWVLDSRNQVLGWARDVVSDEIDQSTLKLKMRGSWQNNPNSVFEVEVEGDRTIHAYFKLRINGQLIYHGPPTAGFLYLFTFPG